ncbi:NEDD4 family-interacting protein 2-like [Limulus polyphemus]|uniref:NEDD4 family-interacting protein 2-like n=1 Tax=Limulus polyphemus TaxID=6850 RepID=A0ABM1BK85_LIMPO|nr:NEDD4 family-interacting protein 2-like [Limulus polyphemus]
MEKGQSSVAYKMLRQQEEEEGFSPPSNTTLATPPQGIPPPAYDELLEGGAVGDVSDVASCTTTNEDRSANLLTSPKGYTTIPVPPPYNVAAAELPTYEEAQRSKGLEGENQRQSDDVTSLWSHGEEVLGTDFLFFTSFFVAFLFNWVGFLLLVCFCQTLAGRYGALAGFGLSLAKWTLIVKHSTVT